ncbi:MAG: hypothetical protein ACREJC_07760 [Tepidisphaeraceae bacterium]
MQNQTTTFGQTDGPFDASRPRRPLLLLMILGLVGIALACMI